MDMVYGNKLILRVFSCDGGHWAGKKNRRFMGFRAAAYFAVFKNPAGLAQFPWFDAKFSLGGNRVALPRHPKRGEEGTPSRGWRWNFRALCGI